MRRGRVLAAIAFLLAAGTVGYTLFAERREAEIKALLESIDRAEQETPYAGTRTTTVWSNGTASTSTMKLWSDGPRIQAELVDTRAGGKKAAAWKTGYLGGVPSMFRPGRGTRGRVHDVDLLLRNYQVRISGRRAVAGREGDVVEIVSRHKGRPSYRIVADRQNRFPLSFEVIGEDGAAVLESRFDSIEFAPSFPAGIFDEKKPDAAMPSWIAVTEEPIAPHRLSEQGGFAAWTATDVPAGFRLVSAERIRVVTTPPPILKDFKMDLRLLHLTYSDGMACFSVVQFTADNPVWKMIRSHLPPVESRGALVARKFSHPTGTALLIEMDSTVVLLAGNVSGADLEASARSLVRN